MNTEHTITESFRLEKTLLILKSDCPHSTAKTHMSQRATSSHFLNSSRNGDSTTFLGSLFQSLRIFSMKEILIFNLNLSWNTATEYKDPNWNANGYSVQQIAARKAEL